MDRFKSPRIQDDRHMLTVMTYSDLNGVRAGKDKSPEESKWSSYAYYAYGKVDPLITPAINLNWAFDFTGIKLFLSLHLQPYLLIAVLLCLEITKMLLIIYSSGV